MNRILKNRSREHVKTVFRGRIVEFKPRNSRIFDTDDEEQRALYSFFKDTYGFIEDITDLFKKEGDVK